MPTIYPAAPPTVSGDLTTIYNFLNTPTAVAQRVRELSAQRFIADFLLTGRTEAPSGSIAITQSEPLYLPVDPEPVSPGAEYPRTSETRPTVTIASITKWGEGVPITDEAIGRFRGDAVNRAMIKAVNTMVKKVDSVSLAAIGTAVTQTQAAIGAWSGGTANPFLDSMLAKADIDELDFGYDADTVVLSPTAFAYLADTIKGFLPRESADGVISSGEVPGIAGLTFVTSTRLPNVLQPIVLDRDMLGGLAYERIPSPEFDGDPANGVQTSITREAEKDQWLLRVRRPIVPYIQEPGAAVKITGALS